MSDTIFDVLKKEHRAVLDLLKKAESAKGSNRSSILEKIKAELIPHARGEEKTLYALLRDRAKSKSEDEALELANEAYEEHRAIDKLLGDLEKINVSDEKWLAHLTVIKENVEHHIKEEEDELFGHAKDLFDRNELVQLCDSYLTEKEKFSKTLPTQSQIEERSASESARKFAS